MDNKLNGDLDKEGIKVMVPTPCNETLDPLAIVIKGK